MAHRGVSLLVLVILLMLPYSARGGTNVKDSLDILKKECGEETIHGNNERALELASKLEAMAEKASRGDYILYAKAQIGQNKMILNRYEDGKKILVSILPQATKMNDLWVMTTAYNALAIYEVSVKYDYSKALEYLLEGYNAAEKAGDQSRMALLSCNIANLYNLRNDSKGLEYSLSAYEYGQKNHNEHMIFAGAYVSASIYSKMKDYNSALKYIKVAEPLADKYYDKAGVYSVYGDILAGLGRDDEAGKFYKQAMLHLDKSESTASASACLSYGRFLLEKKDYADAQRIFDIGIQLSNGRNNRVFRYLIYKGKAQAYKESGNYKKALDCFEIYHNESDSIFNVEKISSLNSLSVKYETEKQKRIAQEEKSRAERYNRIMTFSLVIVGLLGVFLAFIAVAYKKQNKLYKSIVAQSMRKYSVSSLSDDMSSDLFSKLEKLMKDEHLYRDKTLNKDMLIKLTGSNTTYLSQVVNENSGVNISNYINGYRVEEALMFLSDPQNNDTMHTIADKVGFSSLSTFYRVFTDKVGMSPAKFRGTRLKMESK